MATSELIREGQSRYTEDMATTDKKAISTVRVYDETRDLLNMVAALNRGTVADVLEPVARVLYAEALAKASRAAEKAVKEDPDERRALEYAEGRE